MPELAAETTQTAPRIRRVPVALYLHLFAAIRYAVTSGLDSDFEQLDQQLIDLLAFQQPDNDLVARDREYEEWTERVRAKEAQLDELIRRLLIRCIELNVATDAEIAEFERERAESRARATAHATGDAAGSST